MRLKLPTEGPMPTDAECLEEQNRLLKILCDDFATGGNVVSHLKSMKEFDGKMREWAFKRCNELRAEQNLPQLEMEYL